MNYPNFIRFFTANLDVQPDEITALISQCECLSVKKNDILLQQGDYCKHSFFVENGLLRQYAFKKNGKEYILSFAPENWVITDRDSVYFNLPAKYSIQALEDSSVVLIDENFMLKISKLIPGFNEFNTRLLHNHVRHLQERISLLLSADAEERYLKFIDLYPDMLSRVPQIMIASYLGITPESLSRVRKEILLKNQKR